MRCTDGHQQLLLMGEAVRHLVIAWLAYAEIVAMWILFVRAPRPDAPYWPGRRWLAAIDALLWPGALVVLILLAPVSGGVVGLTVAAGAIVAMPFRLQRSLWRNERYAFTASRWAMPLLWLLAMGIVLKLLLSW